MMDGRRKEFLKKWIAWLESDIRFGNFSSWEKDNKRELKLFFEELLESEKMK